MSARILTHFEQNVKVKRPFSGSKSLYILCILSGLGHIRADLMIIYTQDCDVYIWYKNQHLLQGSLRANGGAEVAPGLKILPLSSHAAATTNIKKQTGIIQSQTL